MAVEELALTPHERVAVVEATPDALVVEATYDPHGTAPPRHLHPAQDERFEVLEGELTARVDQTQRCLRPGDTLEIPRGSVHQMWNAGPTPARVRWTTAPAGRTLDWFRALDRLDRPGPLAFAVYLTEFRDVFRLAGPLPAPLVSAALAALAPLGRLRGYDARASEASPAGT